MVISTVSLNKGLYFWFLNSLQSERLSFQLEKYAAYSYWSFAYYLLSHACNTLNQWCSSHHHFLGSGSPWNGRGYVWRRSNSSRQQVHKPQAHLISNYFSPRPHFLCFNHPVDCFKSPGWRTMDLYTIDITSPKYVTAPPPMFGPVTDDADLLFLNLGQ